MTTLTSGATFVAALRRSNDIRLCAYTLSPGRVLDALVEAAERGARVCVRLAADPYGGDGIVRSNLAAIARLVDAGADAASASGSRLHLKAAIVDDVAYFDDRNWPSRGNDTVVRDDAVRDVSAVRAVFAGCRPPPDARVALEKRAALAREVLVIDQARRGESIIVSTESFGAGNGVYAALGRAARRGAHVRVLVNAAIARENPAERRAIAALQREGISIRAGSSSEKFAVTGGRVWVGSANATVDVARQLDWGVALSDPRVACRERRAFEMRWAKSGSM